MTMELLTNTAVRIPVGPLVDPTDGKTAETALTVTVLSVQIYQTKNDGSAVVRAAFSPTASGGSNDMALVTSSTDGMYDLELTAAQLNFYGNARLTLYDVDGFLVWWVDLHVVSANHFNNKYGTTIPPVNATQLAGVTQSLTDLKDFADAGYDPATNKVQGVVLVDTTTTNTDMVSEPMTSAATATTIAAELATYDGPTNAEMEARTILSAEYTIVSDLGTVQTADHTAAIADIPTVAEFNARSLPSADYVVVGDTIAGVTTVTNLTNAATNGDFTATQKASINTEVDSAWDTAIGTPPAGSRADYVKRIKFAVCNKWTITEASGNLDVFDDSDVSFLATATAFTTLAGVTTRKKIL